MSCGSSWNCKWRKFCVFSLVVIGDHSLAAIHVKHREIGCIHPFLGVPLQEGLVAHLGENSLQEMLHIEEMNVLGAKFYPVLAVEF